MFEQKPSSNWFKMGQPSDQSISFPTRACRLFTLALASVFAVGLLVASPPLTTKAQAKKAESSRKKKGSTKKRRIKKLQKLKKLKALKRRSLALRETLAQNGFKKSLNQNTVTLMSGCCTTGAYTAFGADIKDMVKQLGDKNGLRVLPILGGGAGTNVRDLLYLRGVDMAIINTDVIDYYKGKPLYKNLDKRIQYITKLFNEEVHLYAGDKVASLVDLHGKRVGFNNSSAEVTGKILFKKLGIKPLETVRISEGDGALALKEGRLDAMMRVTGKPIRDVSRLKEIFPKIRFLPIAYDPAFIGSYLPTQLTHEDYPGLIGKGKLVPTIAIRPILAVFNWPRGSERYRRLSKFTKSFFDNFTRLRRSKNLHPKWAEVNLQATVPGMARFTPAEDWIEAQTKVASDQNSEDNGAGKPNNNIDLMASFKQFMAGRKDKTNSGNSEKLFAEFLRWQQQKR